MNQLGVPQCQCGPGYTGNKCEIDQCTDFCRNGGTCIRNAKKATCQCPAGWTGKRCETKTSCTDPDGCPQPETDGNIYR